MIRGTTVPLDMSRQLQSELAFFYLDDGTLGGRIEKLHHDLEEVRRVGASIGLELNARKYEIVSVCDETVDACAPLIPEARVVSPFQAMSLGSSVGDVDSISSVLQEKITMLKRMGERLQLLNSHDAILLLKHSFSLPKLL